ncbi:MAG: hypothetical protein WCP56_03165 [Candidatus Saccharibacteria bacterium]
MPESIPFSDDSSNERKPLTVPDLVPVATEKDRMVDLAIDLVDTNGKDDSTGNTRTALFYVPDNDAGDNKYPTLKIIVPKEEVSNKYPWRAQLTFGNQDPSLSTLVSIRKDGTIVTYDYASKKYHELDDVQVKNFLGYLETIKNNLILDEPKYKQ